jgi:chemotaxis protein MotB
VAKEREEPEVAGAPDWIVTFADMISLLVTFFILLMTFSSLEALDTFQAPQNILGTTGTLTTGGGPSSVDPPDVDVMMAKDVARGSQVPHSRNSSELLENLEEMGQKNTEEHTEIDLNAIADGLVIRFDDRASFAPGSIEPSRNLFTVATELARVLEHYSYTVVIEGHTDDHFRSTQLHRNATALSAARADSVAQAMIAESNLSPKQIQIAALGDSVPKEANDTPEGRRSNRRVEIRVMSLSLARTAALNAQEVSDG